MTKMKKSKVLAGLLLVVSLAFSLAFFASCYMSAGGGLEYTLDGGGNVVIRNYADRIGVSEVVIPDQIDGKDVVEIANFGVINTEQLRTVKIGKNVKTIGAWAFANNVRLERFEVDPENEYFTANDGVLYTKDMETLLAYPTGAARNVWQAGGGDLDEKKIVKVSFTVPETVKKIADNAFYENWYITEVVLPYGLTEIGENSFAFCGRITSVRMQWTISALPSTLTKIGKDAFCNCSTLKYVIIPASVEYIGDYAFYNAARIKECRVMKTETETAGWGTKWYPTQSGDDLDNVVKYLR